MWAIALFEYMGNIGSPPPLIFAAGKAIYLIGMTTLESLGMTARSDRSVNQTRAWMLLLTK